MDIPKFEDLFKQIKTNCCILGIDIYNYQVFKRFYIMFAILFVAAMQEIIYFILYTSYDNFLKITQLFPCICTCSLSLIKVIITFIKWEEIQDLKKCFKALYQNIIKNEKSDLIFHDLSFLVKLNKYVFILNTFLINVYNFSSLFEMLYSYIKTKEVLFILPYPLWVPFSTDNWVQWSVIYLYSSIAGYFCIFFSASFDATYFIFSTQVHINFTDLCERIKQLNVNNVDTLNDIIRNHQYIIRLSQRLDDIFKVPNLFNVTYGCLQICLLGFTIMMGDWSQVPKCVLFILSILLQLLVISFFGENIKRESARVGEAAFLCKWHDMDEKRKRTILIIMSRAHRPQTLTAYKFSTICFALFAQIISRSWSFFSILRTVYNSK